MDCNARDTFLPSPFTSLVWHFKWVWFSSGVVTSYQFDSVVGEMWGIVGKLGDAGRPCVQITTPAPGGNGLD